MPTSHSKSVITQRSARLLTSNEAEDYLGLGRGTLPVWRSTGRVQIPFLRLGTRKVLYDIADLEKWLESCKVRA